MFLSLSSSSDVQLIPLLRNSASSSMSYPIYPVNGLESNNVSGFRGSALDCGWSAVGGQGQSAYVRGGFRPDDSFFGHSVSH